jgi:hypothetical protein
MEEQEYPLALVIITARRSGRALILPLTQKGESKIAAYHY